MKLCKKTTAYLLAFVFLISQFTASAMSPGDTFFDETLAAYSESGEYADEQGEGMDEQGEGTLILSVQNGNDNKFGPYESGYEMPRAVTPFDDKEKQTAAVSVPPDFEYDPNTLMVKLKAKPSNDGFTLMSAEDGIDLEGVSKLEPLLDLTTTEAKKVLGTNENTGWFKATLEPGQSVEELLLSLGESSEVLCVEPNYIRKSMGSPDLDLSGNTKIGDQWYLNSINAFDAWDDMNDKGLAGGSKDVIVAVIDTGVDYTHEDLRDSMWVNPGEINNGQDNDNNGYVDDIYGACTVGSQYAGHSGDPMDDNGHGTHIAGIIAADNNSTGIVGIAYNTKIMALKAGNASGYFTDESIVSAVKYAVENGADIINMSFGSYMRSQLVENALQLAYQYCVLIASAGNDAYPNLPHMEGRDFYPAAYPWVVGVMSMDETPDAFGSYLSSFSNWDYKAEDSHEYQVMAPGSGIMSTLPGNKYGKWSGTSMAAPVVSGIAALLRAQYADKNEYSSRFIMGQLAATGDKLRGSLFSLDYLGQTDPTYYTVDAYKALTTAPKPRLTYLEHYVFDLESISEDNDENGVVDAGEIIDLALVIRNQWGTAHDVTVTLDTNDPYVTWQTQTVNYGEISNFATADNGLTKDADGAVSGVINGFRFSVPKDTPNDYIIDFTITMKAKNGISESDMQEYVFDKQTLKITVRNGKILPNRITENMTLTKDTYWIIPHATLIEERVTVIAETGTQIQFWSSQAQDPYAALQVPVLYVNGKFICAGTADEPVELFASPVNNGRKVEIKRRSGGEVDLSYTKVMNPVLDVSEIDHCYFTQANFNYITSMYEDTNGYRYEMTVDPTVKAAVISNSIFSQLGSSSYGFLTTSGKRSGNLFDSCSMQFTAGDDEGNVFLKNNRLVETQYGDRSIWGSALEFSSNNMINLKNWNAPKYVVKNPANGSTYFAVSLNSTEYDDVTNFAKSLGGHIITINDESELMFINKYIKQYFHNSDGGGSKYETIQKDYPGSDEYYFYYMATGYNDFDGDGIYTWENGENPAYRLSIEPSLKGGYVSLYVDSNNFENKKYEDLKSWGSYTIIEIPGEVELEEIKFVNSTLQVGADDGDIRLNITYLPAKPQTIELLWSSSDPAVLTVDNGIMTPHSCGTAAVTVSTQDGRITASCTVTVIETIQVTNLQIDETYKKLPLGASYTINPIITPANATNRQINWVSDDSKVAIVDDFGTVTAVGIGSCTITGTLAKDPAMTVTLNIEAVKPITGINLSQEFAIVEIGGSVNLIAETVPIDSTDTELRFKSSDENIATVSDSGLITAVGVGNAVITVSSAADGSMAALCIVSVVNNAADMDATAVNSSDNSVTITNLAGEVYMLGQTGSHKERFGLDVQKDLLVPEKVNGINDVKKVISNSYFTVALKNDGTVWAWGYDGWSYFGTEYVTANSSTPINIAGIDGVVDIAVGYYHYLFLKNDGTVWVMGDGSYGRLGLGDVGNIRTPTKINSLVNIVEIRTNGDTSFALDRSGVLYTWGYYNNSGYNYTPINADVPGLVESINYGTGRRLVLKTTTDVFYYFEPGSSVPLNKITNPNITEAAQDIKQILYFYDSEYMILKNDGTIWIQSNGNNYSGIPKMSSSAYGKYSDLSNIDSFVGTNDFTYFLTKDGKIFVYSRNNANFPLGNGENARSTDKPKQVLFGMNPEINKPVLSDSVPANNASDVEINEKITLNFNKAIKKGSSFSMIKLYTQGGNGRTVESKVYIDGKSLIIIPQENLDYGTDYFILIPQGAIIDLVGNIGDFNELSFKTKDNLNLFGLLSEDFTLMSTTGIIQLTQKEAEIKEALKIFINERNTGSFKDNAILNVWNSTKNEYWMKLYGYGSRWNSSEDYSHYVSTAANNFWGTTSEKLIETAIIDTTDDFNYGGVVYKPFLTTAPENCYPFVTDAYVCNDTGRVTNVGPELITFVVEFNRDMDINKPLNVTFGTDVPYADYTVNGDWVDERKWEGTYTITALTGGGNQYIKIMNGAAADDPWLVTGIDSERFGFVIQTTGAQSMNLFASSEDDGIALTWRQDDFDILVGYNIYRIADNESEPIKINSHIIDKDVFEFVDSTVEPGKRYSYYFTVVLSNGSDSNSTSNTVDITAKDTIPPVITHSPVLYSKANTAISVYANITDNVGIREVQLYYRSIGETEYKQSEMVTVDEMRYSAIISSNSVGTTGVEYYIIATDYSGNTSSAGNNLEPLEAVVPSAETVLLGDTNDDGVVNAADALTVLQVVVGKIKLTQNQAAAADMNEDGEITAVDALLILQIASKMQ